MLTKKYKEGRDPVDQRNPLWKCQGIERSRNKTKREKGNKNESKRVKLSSKRNSNGKNGGLEGR